MNDVKKPLAQRIALSLKAEIFKGRWAEQLPGILTLCDEMNVSRQTMMLAIRHLESMGVVAAAQPGKPRWIIDPSPRNQPENQRSYQKIGIITSAASPQLSRSDRELVEALHQGITQQGRTALPIIFNQLHQERGAQQIGHLLNRHPADLYYVIKAHQKYSEFFNSQSPPMVFIGGDQNTALHPTWGFGLISICRQGIQILQSIGHSRIIVLLPALLSGSEAKRSQTEDRVKQLFSEAHLPYSLFNTPRHDGSAIDIIATLEKSFKVTPPSALIVSDSDMIPSVISFLMQQRLRYPDDLSLICLDNHPYLKNFHPPISHAIKSPEKLARNALRCIDELIETGQLTHGAHMIKTDFHQTLSVAPPPKNARAVNKT